MFLKIQYVLGQFGGSAVPEIIDGLSPQGQISIYFKRKQEKFTMNTKNNPRVRFPY